MDSPTFVEMQHQTCLESLTCCTAVCINSSSHLILAFSKKKKKYKTQLKNNLNLEPISLEQLLQYFVPHLFLFCLTLFLRRIYNDHYVSPPDSRWFY